MPALLRRSLFWLHLVCGLAAGAVITVVALTGAALAYEDRIIAWFESGSVSAPPAGETPVAFLPSALIARMENRHPGDRVTSFRIHRDGHSPISLRLRDGGGLLLHPQTWEELPAPASRVREFFSLMLRLHRTLAAPARSAEETGLWHQGVGSNLVGAATAALLLLSLSGLVLWWPRHRTTRVLRTLLVPRWKARGHGRDWNWHHALGFWSAAPLAILALTGLALIYEPVADFIYPGSAERPPPVIAPRADAPIAPPDDTFRQVEALVPDWTYLIFYLPRQNRDGTYQARPLTHYVRTAVWPSQVYTTLRFDPFTGALLEKTAWADRSFFSALRALNDSIHTGEAFGWAGQTVAFTSCLAALLLVYTGFSLSLRRLRRHRLSVCAKRHNQHP